MKRGYDVGARGFPDLGGAVDVGAQVAVTQAIEMTRALPTHVIFIRTPADQEYELPADATTESVLQELGRLAGESPS